MYLKWNYYLWMRQYLENIKTLNGFDALGDINYDQHMKCVYITHELEKFQLDGEKMVAI